MTPHERAAYNAGLRAAIYAARMTAITMETAPGLTDVRKQAAVAALYAFADAPSALALTTGSAPSSRCIPAEFSVAETISGLDGPPTAIV
ncbi:MAG: hypothetical protein EOO77_01130 [Oxalobacteraceae bacterium]|nr:MAG: hypothetical protein EOO77_01130 [Oxalobacteraceae bacterium]